MQKALITNPFNLKQIDTENLRRLVKYLKIAPKNKVKGMKREELIKLLSYHDYIKLKFKL